MFIKPTKEASELKEALEKLGVRVLAEVDDGYKHIDLSIPSARINIEVDGNQHLTDPNQIVTDIKRSHYSENLGYDTLRVPNHAVRSDLEAIAHAIAEAVKIRGKYIGNSKPISDMGETSYFKGKSECTAIKEVYGESAELFADIIKSKLPKGKYSLLDIGSSKGELLTEVLKLLSDYSFDITVTDINEKALSASIVSGKKLVADAEALPIPEHSIDVALMRYVLQFNKLEHQINIVNQISRVIKGFAIVQHAGSDNENPDDWRRRIDKVFKDEQLPQLKRDGMYWSSASELEAFMSEKGIKFERVEEKKIDCLSDVYTERYSLTEMQNARLKELIGDKNYILRTTWVINPK